MLARAAVATARDVFTAPEAGKYADGFAVNVQLKISGDAVNANSFPEVELAVFVGGECRDVISINQNTARFNRGTGFFMTRAMGSEKDNGKDVTFKAVVNGVAYKFTNKLTYKYGESYTEVPYVLNLDRVLGVELTNPIVIEQKKGTTYDITKDISFVYTSQAFNYTPMGQSSLDTDVTPLSYEWDFSNSASYFSIDEKGILTVKDETSKNGAYLGCTVSTYRSMLGGASTNIIIKEPAIPVTGLNLAKTSVDAWVGQSVWDYVNDQFVTILPANASNKNYGIRPTSATLAAGGINEKMQIEKRGTWTVEVYSLDNMQISKTLTINAKQHVSSISTTERQLVVNKGENVFDKVKDIIVISPADADNKELICQEASGNNGPIIDATGVAIATGETEVMVTSADTATASTFVRVVVVQPVTSITAPKSIECWKGDNFYNIIGKDIVVNPSDATDPELILSQIDGPQGGMNEKGTFDKAGTYKVRLTAKSNEKVTVDITVLVKQPVESIELGAQSIEVNVGENVYDAIAKVLTVLPADAYNKNVNYITRSQLISQSGIALAVGECVVTVLSEENPQLGREINVKIINPVTAIKATPAEITVTVGTNVYDYISKNVSIAITPSTTDQSAYEVNVDPRYGNYFPKGMATSAGDYTWVVTSTENRQISTNITVHVVDAVKMTGPRAVDVSLSRPTTVPLSVTEGKANFKPSLVSAEVADTDVAEVSSVSSDGLSFTITAKKLGKTTYTVKYDGNVMCTGEVNVFAQLSLVSGWNWISNYTDQSIALYSENSGYYSGFFTGDSKVYEMRSQSELLFNDDKYGVFGQITDIEAGTMYKVNVAGERAFISQGNLAANPTVSWKGYTWIAYPVIGDHSFDYINDNKLLSSASDGDVIIGKDGFAEFVGVWQASAGFKLETGKGYIYYQEEAAQKTLDFGPSYVTEPGTATSRSRKARSAEENVWMYDASAFADNMCIVTKVKGIQADEKYTIGAFVGDECRGMGTFVNDDVMFINVAGKAGEVVSFRLYNSETGLFSDIAETVNYTFKKGSLRAPISLTSSEDATAISGISSDASADAPAYNVAGQRVNASAKGIVIKGGKKYFNK